MTHTETYYDPTGKPLYSRVVQVQEPNQNLKEFLDVDIQLKDSLWDMRDSTDPDSQFQCPLEYLHSFQSELPDEVEEIVQ